MKIKNIIYLILSSNLLLVCAVAQSSKQYILREGNTIQIEMKGVSGGYNAEINGEYTIRNGVIKLPYITPIRVAGKTTVDIENLCVSAYKNQQIFTNPFFYVTLLEDKNPLKIWVTGQVKSSGNYKYESGMRLSQALALAGGFTDWAKKTKVKIVRNGRFSYVNYKEIEKDPKKDIIIEPGDQIEVR